MSNELEILENGDYRLPDGRVISKDEVTRIYEEKQKPKTEDGLQEGQCSGPIKLQD